jgi:hypothetical protein
MILHLNDPRQYIAHLVGTYLICIPTYLQLCLCDFHLLYKYRYNVYSLEYIIEIFVNLFNEKIGVMYNNCL